MYPQSLQKLIEAFRRIPGVGEKTAERYALAVSEMEPSLALDFARAVEEVKTHLTRCKICGNLSDRDTCTVCEDVNRNHKMIFVVQSPRDVIAMEKTGQYRGVYHVLNGLLSPSKGMMPEDLNLDTLVERARKAEEVIIATNATMDGETTAMYIDRLLKETCPDLLVTRIAHGLPAGGLLDYADEMTLAHALSDRRQM